MRQILMMVTLLVCGLAGAADHAILNGKYNCRSGDGRELIGMSLDTSKSWLTLDMGQSRIYGSVITIQAADNSTFTLPMRGSKEFSVVAKFESATRAAVTLAVPNVTTAFACEKL